MDSSTIKKYFIFVIFNLKDFFFHSMQDFNTIHAQLSQMLEKLKENQPFKKFLKKTSQKLHFEKNNFLSLTTEKVLNTHLNFKSKISCKNDIFELTKNVQSSTWLQNQLRMFIYVMCGHLFLKKITVFQLKQQDYDYLSIFFPLKRREHLQYQVKLLTCNKNIKWSFEESKMFQQLMRKYKDSKRWNHVAKELFILSKKKYFKTPKQCRQRWNNHIDPSKLKGKWSLTEDDTVIKCVINFGKKWTLISSELKNTRTENSVKNRYNSLIKFAKKEYGSDKSQQDLMHLISSNITKQLQNNNQPVQSQPQSISKHQASGIQIQMSKIDVSLSYKVTVEKQIKIQGQNDKIMDQPNIDFNQDHKSQVQRFSYEPKYMFDESEQVQNIAWNNSQSEEIGSPKFYLLNGSLCFDQNFIL